jgi:hypothetical protein
VPALIDHIQTNWFIHAGGLFATPCLQSYVAQLLPANSSDPNALSMSALQGATLIQIHSSAAVLALAKSAGFDSIQAFMPGLQMFWDDVSAGFRYITSKLGRGVLPGHLAEHTHVTLTLQKPGPFSALCTTAQECTGNGAAKGWEQAGNRPGTVWERGTTGKGERSVAHM